MSTERKLELVRPGDMAGGGSKKDFGKCPVVQGCLQYFPMALMAVAWVSEYGFRKYGSWGGWKKVPNGSVRYLNAKGRHFLKEFIEGPYDDGDSALAHAAQDAWNALARLEKLLEEGQLEMRMGNEIKDGLPILG